MLFGESWALRAVGSADAVLTGWRCRSAVELTIAGTTLARGCWTTLLFCVKWYDCCSATSFRLGGYIRRGSGRFWG